MPKQARIHKIWSSKCDFLNGVSVDKKNKIVYFTDMRSDGLWKLEKGQLVKSSGRAAKNT